MDMRWFKGVQGAEEKAKRKAEVLAYRRAFEALTEILEAEYEEGSPDYDLASWSHKQADRNGANRKLKSILHLINIQE